MRKSAANFIINGSQWIDEHLFNGEYYVHIIHRRKTNQKLPKVSSIESGAKNLFKPDYQLGPGCLVDQLVGQLFAHVCGLGYLVE